MYIIISSNPEAPVQISRKLHKALQFKDNQKIIGAVSISQIKGTDKFCIVRRSPEETFQQQCSLVTRNPNHDKRMPSIFHFTIPSLEYIRHITGLQIINSKVVKVKPKTLPNGITIYVLQT